MTSIKKAHAVALAYRDMGNRAALKIKHQAAVDAKAGKASDRIFEGMDACSEALSNLMNAKMSLKKLTGIKGLISKVFHRKFHKDLDREIRDIKSTLNGIGKLHNQAKKLEGSIKNVKEIARLQTIVDGLRNQIAVLKPYLTVIDGPDPKKITYRSQNPKGYEAKRKQYNDTMNILNSTKAEIRILNEPNKEIYKQIKALEKEKKEIMKQY